MATVKANVSALTTRVPNLQTRLHFFSQCTIQKAPHLLGAGVIHSLPLDFDAHHWEEWNGPLTSSVSAKSHCFWEISRAE